MKKVKNLLIIFCLLVLVSCSKMLEEEPYGVYSNLNFYNTESDALSALLYTYVPLNYIEYQARFVFYMGDVPTNQYTDYDKALETGLYTWDVDANTDEFLYLFKYCYISIGRANSVIENVAVMDNITEEKRSQFVGEAYFLRAYNYFMLVKNYGSVVYHEKSVTSSSDVFKDKASIEDLYGYIIDDLNKAIKLLEVNKKQGRADKVAAQAMLSKVYLTMASSKWTDAPGYEWVSDYEEMYGKAAEAAAEVLNGQSTYGLDTDLSRVYDVDHQADGVEHIFITSMNRDATGEEGTYSQLPQMFGLNLANVYIPKELGTTTPVQQFINHPWTNWSVFRVDSNFYNSYSDSDLRKQLMVTTVYDANGNIMATYGGSNPDANFYHPFCRKYTDYNSVQNQTSANCYLIRFAEVALTYAEAAGPTSEGYKWVNLVRSRAELGSLQSGMSVDDFRKAIWDEKEKELAFEGHGLYELRRTGRVMQKITNKTPIEQYAYFYPIPQRELDLNQ